MACYRNESSPNPSKRCSKCLSSTLKDAFAKCHGLCCKFSTSRLENEEEEEEALTSDYGDEDEEFVSAVISKYLESKFRQKMSLTSENFCCDLTDFSPAAGDLFIPANAMQQKLGNNNGEEREEFVSVGSHFSHCSSSAGSVEAFVSANTSFSRCSSLSRIDFPDLWRRRSNILQFSQCQGWPFGLCRRALLLPPPPKSPSDSWKWRKTAGLIKLH